MRKLCLSLLVLHESGIRRIKECSVHVSVLERERERERGLVAVSVFDEECEWVCVLVHERVGVSVCMRFCEECVYEHYFIYVFCESVCVGDCVSMGVCVCASEYNRKR